MMKRRTRSLNSGFRLFLISTPLLALMLVFAYLPLIGWSIAFFDYHPGVALSDSTFVGLKYFAAMISNPVALGEIRRVMVNTFAISGIGLVTSLLPVLFAVFLMEIRSKIFRKVVQTLTTLPNFVSWVVVYAIVWAMLSVEDGFVNKLLVSLNVIDEPINFLVASDNVGVWLTMTAYGIYKGLGWGAIMYIAAIATIDSEQYEAAIVDGAGRFQSMWYITLPGILPTYFVLLLLQIANFINNGMDQYYVFMNPMNKSAIEVLDLYVYLKGLLGQQISYSTAIGMLKSLVSVVLLFIANGVSYLVRKQTVI